MGATQGDGPAYRGQQVARLRLPGIQAVGPTTITTGLISYVGAISTNEVTGFATRFGSTFDEYRILGVRMRIAPLGVNPGISCFWFDEKNSSAPTVTEAYERIATRRSNNSADSKSTFTMTWTARDLLDLQYTAIGTVATPCYFKVYTDNATFGAPVAVTSLWIIDFELMVEFRGVKSS
jgi:hypothetical protein